MNGKSMKKHPLNKKLSAEHQSDEAVLMGGAAIRTVDKITKNECIKKQFAQDALIHQRVKCPVMAMVCCLIHQV